MPQFSISNCDGCSCSTCLWHQFSGFDLSELLMNRNLLEINLSIDSYSNKNDLISAHNSQVTITRSRIWDLWKEYFGIRMCISDMKVWNDYFTYGDLIMSETPPCIKFHICNCLPYLQVDASNSIVVKKLSYTHKSNGDLTWKNVFVDSTYFFPNKGMLQ